MFLQTLHSSVAIICVCTDVHTDTAGKQVRQTPSTFLYVETLCMLSIAIPPDLNILKGQQVIEISTFQQVSRS